MSDRISKFTAGGQKTPPDLSKKDSAAAPRAAWQWLLLVPFLGLLWPPMYAKTAPELFGFPFFYWYQFAWVILSAVLTGFVYFATRRRQSHD